MSQIQSMKISFCKMQNKETKNSDSMVGGFQDLDIERGEQRKPSIWLPDVLRELQYKLFFLKAMIRTLYQFCLKLNESSEHQDESATRLGQNVPQELSEVSIIIKFLSSMQS